MSAAPKAGSSAPNSSIFTSGVVGVLLAASGIASKGFYGIGLTQQGALILGLLGFAFSAGVLLHARDSMLHRQAPS